MEHRNDSDEPEEEQQRVAADEAHRQRRRDRRAFGRRVVLGQRIAREGAAVVVERARRLLVEAWREAALLQGSVRRVAGRVLPAADRPRPTIDRGSRQSNLRGLLHTTVFSKRGAQTS